jgi:hypothetical protein|tara:strand:- start:997 stop:1422 length:426 start_codon:yes stop_codon:yes gene_type:complete
VKNKDVEETEMLSENDRSYIAQLEAERLNLERKVEELQIEIRLINNLIYKKKSESLAFNMSEKLNKKNSERLFYETIILQALASSQQGLRTSEIQRRVATIGYKINYNTLRSYVTKLRDKNLIKKKAKNSYKWVQTPEAEQ